ncbi:MAG: hypothetical protein IKF97_00945 [Clostridia bacterium]|nr:hypothetical protein [Clostridia bacterium]
MNKIGFIGAYDKIDMILNVAKILTLCDKKVLVIDSTINQKARYIVPAINPATSYVTDYEDIDVAIGFNSIEQIKQYLMVDGDLPYDIILIDIDNPYNIEGFELNETQKNFFVTAFDVFNLKRGLQIISLIKNPLKMTKILFSENISKEEDDYLNYLALGYKVMWDENRIYFPLENGDWSVIAENERSAKIKFKRLSQQYKDSLLIIANEIASDVGEAQIKRAIKFVERGM